MAYTYKYPRPMVTIDAIIFREENNCIEILLIKRGNQPFKNMWALPGGFVDMDEDLIDAVNREVAEETGLKNIDFEQFKTFGKPDRDPRGRNISVVFCGKLSNSQIAKSGDDASDTKWFDIKNLPELAFDHNQILNDWYSDLNLK